MMEKLIRKDLTRNQRQASRRLREKKWLEQNGWRSWEALHTALMKGMVFLTPASSEKLKSSYYR